ncbi:Crp/Fnr family transcriptional regulator [Myroides indicus]|uniref:Cyclic nucleotide-binding domain-containing protein n=1 Tax=Myroides indicus TaxID=1323422 RepID=A0A4R7ESI0_9FLAO|nr:hypothetical protein [Myroides indicus]TDS51266.1 hypothetical protein C8P70_13911 [Myroides indicus]
MILEKLLKEFDADINALTLEESELFDSYFESITVQRNKFLVREGEVEKYSYFIYEGMACCWTLNPKGEEQTFWFCKEGTFSMSNIAFILEKSQNLMYKYLRTALFIELIGSSWLNSIKQFPV